MLSEKPLLNVIIPTFNSQRFDLLKETVQSVQNQTYGRENIRIILAINGTDLVHKKAVEDTYAEVKNITCLYTPRSNGPTALNNAIRHLTDGYMFILDDDDYLTAGYLEELCSHVDSDIDIVFGRTSEQKQDGTLDYATYINRTLMKVGAGKRKLSARESSLLSVHAGHLFNTQTVKKSVF